MSGDSPMTLPVIQHRFGLWNRGSQGRKSAWHSWLGHALAPGMGWNGRVQRQVDSQRIPFSSSAVSPKGDGGFHRKQRRTVKWGRGIRLAPGDAGGGSCVRGLRKLLCVNRLWAS